MCLVLLCCLFLGHGVRPENFSCFKTFRDQYSVYVRTIPLALDKMVSFKMQYNGFHMDGLLYFDVCSTSALRGICGDESEVFHGRFVFVNYAGTPGGPRCLLMRDKDPEGWTYSTFQPDSEAIKLEGVRALNEQLEIEPVGTLKPKGAVDDIIKDEIKKHVPLAGLLLSDDRHDAGQPAALELGTAEEQLARLQKAFAGGTIRAEFNFFCDKEDPKTRAHFDSGRGALVVNEYSSGGCVVTFSFLRVLNELSWLTGAVFFLAGAALLLGGFKIYKNVFIAFIPVVVVMLGFFLYFGLVDKTDTPFMNVLTCAGILLLMVAAVLVFVYCHSFFYFVVTCCVSLQLAMVLKTVLEQSSDFFEHPLVFYGLFFVLYAVFIALYALTEDLFIVLVTSTAGAVLLLVSLKFLGITEYDLLLDTQLDKFSQFESLDPEARKMLVVFLSLGVFGFVLQYVLVCLERRREKQEADDEEDSELDATQDPVKQPLESIEIKDHGHPQHAQRPQGV